MAPAHILRNRVYVGELNHKGASYPGEHAPLIAPALFDAVQEKLTANRNGSRIQRAASGALLLARIFDDRGNRMTPSTAKKGELRYRYYVSSVLAQGRQSEAGSVRRGSPRRSRASSSRRCGPRVRMSGAAVQVPGAEPGREHLAVHARELALEPHLHVVQRPPRPLLCSLEQARRPALAYHDHRPARLGISVLINEAWYNSLS